MQDIRGLSLYHHSLHRFSIFNLFVWTVDLLNFRALSGGRKAMQHISAGSTVKSVPDSSAGTSSVGAL
jgi:hypothetical protein